MRSSRQTLDRRGRGRPVRMSRAKRLGAVYYMEVRDKFSKDEYPVYIYPHDNLEAIKEQFKDVNAQLIKVE